MSPTATPTPTPPPELSLEPPPADAKIPSAPAAFKGTLPGHYRAVVPNKNEQAVLPGALREVQKLSSFALLAAVIGLTQAQLVELLTLAMQWTQMRNATSAWDDYARAMEGIAWTRLRAIFLRLAPVLASMVAADATIASQNADLLSLLGAKKAAAQRGVTTRKLNKQAEAEGRLPTHGKAGKKRQRAAAKAALAAANAGQATTPAHATATPVATPVAAQAAAPANGTSHT